MPEVRPAVDPPRSPRCTARQATRRAAMVLALLLATGPQLLPPGAAEAAVRRCIGPDGGIIYTDRSCEHFQAREAERAQEQPDPAMGGAGATGAQVPVTLAHSDCARTPDTLLFALRGALEKRDVNTLAGLYHWPGLRQHSATAIMKRLETLIEHSDGSVYLVYPEAAFVVFEPEAWPGLPPEDPIAVRLPQYVANASWATHPVTFELDVLGHAGCWWLQFPASRPELQNRQAAADIGARPQADPPAVEVTQPAHD